MTARGVVAAQWWRKGHSHLDESEIWIRREGAPAKYERVTEGNAKSVWPMWTPDGKGLLFMSDRGGAENIWQTAVGRAAEAVDEVYGWARAVAFDRV